MLQRSVHTGSVEPQLVDHVGRRRPPGVLTQSQMQGRKGGEGQPASHSGPSLEAEHTQRTFTNGESSLTFILGLEKKMC